MKVLSVTVVFLMFVSIRISGVLSFSCPCQSQVPQCQTPPPKNCKGGLVSDACGCCKVCGKVIGEQCGGPAFQFCDDGLICQFPTNNEFDQRPGICKAGRPKKLGETCGPRQQGRCKPGLYCDQISPGNVGKCIIKKQHGY